MAKLKARSTRQNRAAKRAPRFTSLRELKAATYAWCVDEVNRLVGPHPAGQSWWNERQAAALRESITVSDDARAICVELRRTLVAADDFLRAHPEADDGYVNELRRNVAACRWSLSLGRGTPDTSWTPRTYLLAEYDRVREWWWHGRDPRIRDLTILSLLAGNFPEVRKQLKERGVTVQEAVRAEERALGQARRRFREAQSTR